MKKYYPTILGALCLLLAVVLFIADHMQSQPIAACIAAGGSFDVSTNSCSQKTATDAVTKKTASVVASSVSSTKTALTSDIIGSMFAPPPNIINLPFYYDTSSTTDVIRVGNPGQGSGVQSPLQVTGVAIGQWFFEGTIPVVLTDSKGRIIAKSTVTAQGDWQTADFVPFYGILDFVKQQSNTTGDLYFMKYNPSGLSINGEAAVEPIVFQ